MRRAVERLRARVVVRLREVLPEAEIVEGEDDVSVGARGLKRRWIEDPALAWWRH
jgi:hypothetical protein